MIQTYITGNIAIEAGEDEVTVLEFLRDAAFDDKLAQLARHGHRLLPPNSITIFLVGGSL